MDSSRRPLVALFATVAIVAAACSSGSSPSASESAGTSAAPGSSESGSAAPGGSAGGSAAASFGHIGGTVTVVGSWTGSEQDSFMAMVKPFEDATGVQVQYTGSRDLAAQLTTGVQSGNLPDVAGLPGPGLMKQWYAQGALKPLDFVDLNAYKSVTPPGYADLGVASDGKLIGIFVKSAVKSVVYFAKANWRGGDPKTWQDLQSAAKSAATGSTKTWCIGLESGAASGWPATDWIEDIVLHQFGPDVYDKWVAGQQKWTSPEIKQAWQAFGQVVNDAYGGPNYILTTNFGSGANPMFKSPPGCLLTHAGSFITDFFQKQAGAKPTDYDFFPFPAINPQYAGAVEGAGDLFGMFNATPQAKALIQWLLTPDAQAIWVKRGGALSGNKDVPVSDYPDAASQKAAQMLRDAKVFRFDGSDQMPNAMNDAFFKATLDFVKDQSKLDSILSNLDSVQSSAYGG
ncbi:MAG TPA: extracellular solute-binding protein [Candidatus Limnocylindrales bacterium]